MTASISYINLSWAVVGIIDKDVRNGLQSMKRPDEPIEVTIERYVIGYLVFWHIAFIDKEKMNRCNDEKVIELGRKKMEEYIFSHPPIATLPKFYIVFLNQPITMSTMPFLSSSIVSLFCAEVLKLDNWATVTGKSFILCSNVVKC